MVDSDAPSLAEALAAMRNKKHCIGAGIDRRVYRLPGSRWVYKRNHSEREVNQAEYKAYLKFKDKLPCGVAMPKMVMVTENIIAAEFVENEVDSIAPADSNCDFGWCLCSDEGKQEKDCWTHYWRNMLQDAGVIEDIHGGNVRIKNGVAYIIDLGEFY